MVATHRLKKVADSGAIVVADPVFQVLEQRSQLDTSIRDAAFVSRHLLGRGHTAPSPLQSVFTWQNVNALAASRRAVLALRSVTGALDLVDPTGRAGSRHSSPFLEGLRTLLWPWQTWNGDLPRSVCLGIYEWRRRHSRAGVSGGEEGEGRAAEGVLVGQDVVSIRLWGGGRLLGCVEDWAFAVTWC